MPSTSFHLTTENARKIGPSEYHLTLTPAMTLPKGDATVYLHNLTVSNNFCNIHHELYDNATLTGTFPNNGPSFNIQIPNGAYSLTNLEQTINQLIYDASNVGTTSKTTRTCKIAGYAATTTTTADFDSGGNPPLEMTIADATGFPTTGGTIQVSGATSQTDSSLINGDGIVIIEYTSLSGSVLTIDSNSLFNIFDIASGADVKLHQSVKAAQTHGILTVDSTKGFENTTTLTVQDPVSGPVTITYTGITSTSSSWQKVSRVES